MEKIHECGFLPKFDLDRELTDDEYWQTDEDQYHLIDYDRDVQIDVSTICQSTDEFIYYGRVVVGSLGEYRDYEAGLISKVKGWDRLAEQRLVTQKANELREWVARMKELYNFI